MISVVQVGDVLYYQDKRTKVTKTVEVTKVGRKYIFTNNYKINIDNLHEESQYIGVQFYRTPEEVLAAQWVEDNKWKISNDVMRCNDISALRQIANILADYTK